MNLKPDRLTRAFFLLFFVILNIPEIFAQSASDPNGRYLLFDLKKTLATSPEASMLGRFGEVPVGNYTGTANVSIPIYNLQVGDFSVPIDLSYHSSGVKVEDEATWVGLGWSLEPEGAIIQTINGAEDGNEFTTTDPLGYQFLFGRSITGVYSQTASVGYALFSCSLPCCITPNQPQDSQALLTEMVDGVGQPDIYQYNLPGGGSGKFYINPKSNRVVLINKQDSIKFERVGTGWLATTLRGDKFSFNAIETSSANTLEGYTGRTWKLSRIVSANGKTADFSYYKGGYSGTVYNETYHDQYRVVSDVNGGRVIPSTDFTRSSSQLLTQIRTDNAIVKFNLEDRQDIQGANLGDGNGMLIPKRLQSVDIISALDGRKIKSFNFGYTYFLGSNSEAGYPTGQQNSDYLLKRLKLETLTEIGYNNAGQSVALPSYKFAYNVATILPSKNSFAKDFWGYYNGRNNANLIPDLKYFYYSDYDNYRYLMPNGTLNAFNGANRSVDTTKLKAGLLTSIQYPTGGITRFDYQPNAFSNYRYPDITSLSSLPAQIKAIDQNNPGNNKSVDFTIPVTQVAQVSTYIMAGPPNPANNFDSLLPSIVKLSKIENGVSTVIKQWSLSTQDRQQFVADGNTKVWLNEQIQFTAGVQYNISVELPDAIGPQNMAMSQASVQSIITYVDNPTNVSQISFGGGARIASIANYDKDGSLTNKKIFRYVNENGSSSGKLMSPLKYAYYRQLLCVGDLNENGTASDYYVGPFWFVGAQSAIPYSTSAGGNLVGYSRVEETDIGLNSAINGKHIYYYNNTESSTKVNNPDMPNLMNGLIAEEDYLKANSDTVKKISYTYSDNLKALNPLGKSFTGVKVFSNFIGSDACFRQYDPMNGFPTKFQIDFYPINSAWYVLTSKETKDYFDGKTAGVKEGLVYNELGQVTRDSVVSSKNEVLTTYNKFPVDISLSNRTTIQQALIDSSFYDHILEQHLLRNQIETSQTKVTYGLINNQLVRTKVEQSLNRNPFFTLYDFNDYGANKSLKQVAEKSKRVTSMLWSDNNSFVFAEVVNANAIDIAYTSFEPIQSGNWKVSSLLRDSLTATVSGYRSYNLSNGNITKGGLTALLTYKVSYWTKNLTPLTINGTIAGYPIKGATLNGWTYYEHQVTGVTTVTISGTGNIDELRLYPSGAQMSTYTYKPLVGITTSVDAKNMPTYYEYDELGRLKNVKDKDGNIVKHTDYHYQGQ